MATGRGPSATLLEIVEKHVNFVGSPSELPTCAELLVAEAQPDAVPDFAVDGPHTSKKDLLERQYKILRVEATEGLRYSVNAFKEDPLMKDDKYTCIYTSVYVKGYYMTRIGALCRVQFSTQRAERRIKWLQSRRLTPGTVLALTTPEDCFSNICKVATVIQLPYTGGLDQNPPEIDIMWADPSQAVLDPDQEFYMIEARTGYFEAARHTLVGLQLAMTESTALDKYVISGDRSDSMASSVRDNSLLDLTKIAPLLCPGDDGDDELLENLRSHDITKGLPDLSMRTTLDQSQLDAVNRILTKELAIIQGPPGTGKTYTSVTALDVVLRNRKAHIDPPIIVAAQTNHALDLLLSHSMDRGARVLRVGGRTDNEAIAERTAFNLRRQIKQIDPAFGRLDKARKINIEAITALVRSAFPDDLLDPAELVKAGILTQDQHNSLCDDEWIDEVDDGMGPFSMWLGSERARSSDLRERLPDSFFAEEEKDEEFEVDPDLQVVPIADDDVDENRLRGEWIPLMKGWTGKTYDRDWRSKAETLLRTTDDLYKIKKQWRGSVYQVLQSKMLDALMPEFTAHLKDMIECCKKLKINRWDRDLQLVREHGISMIGCTTTGLTKYRGFLAALQPNIVLIEEAAQTRESNITAALFPSINQLVLVGDHKQLTPHCDIAWLGGAPYNLNVSLFERMANLKVPMTTLNRQRRMIPEVRYIVNGFYPELQDHPLVLDSANRPPIPGMGSPVWLFDHRWPEQTDADQSKTNEQEAAMIVNFAVYLIQNGTPSTGITILTYYNGQRKLIHRLLHRQPFVSGMTFRVCTVDSYQGEENDVILLSLVRSPENPEAYSVGFVADENRAVVATSRAKRGFYMFCNIANILSANDESFEVWAPVYNGFSEQKFIDRDNGLPVVCQKHGTKSWMVDPDSFTGNSGGCWVKCGEKRPCGHLCELLCHPMEHEHLTCNAPCAKTLFCGDRCGCLCSDPCECACDTFQEAKKEQMRAVLRQANQDSLSLDERLAAHRATVLREQQRESRSTGLKAILPEVVQGWGQFAKNAATFDRQALDQHRANERRDSKTGKLLEPYIKEIHRPRTLEQGQRKGGGKSTVLQRPAAAGKPSGRSSSESLIANAGPASISRTAPSVPAYSEAAALPPGRSLEGTMNAAFPALPPPTGPQPKTHSPVHPTRAQPNAWGAVSQQQRVARGGQHTRVMRGGQQAQRQIPQVRGGALTSVGVAPSQRGGLSSNSRSGSGSATSSSPSKQSRGRPHERQKRKEVYDHSQAYADIKPNEEEAQIADPWSSSVSHQRTLPPPARKTTARSDPVPQSRTQILAPAHSHTKARMPTQQATPLVRRPRTDSITSYNAFEVEVLGDYHRKKREEESRALETAAAEQVVSVTQRAGILVDVSDGNGSEAKEDEQEAEKEDEWLIDLN